MKTLYILAMALLTLNVVNAQLPLPGKSILSKALLTDAAIANALSTDTIHKSITDTQADSLIKANAGNVSFVVLDVRTNDEYILGHLKNAKSIDFYDSIFNAKIAVLDRDKTYLVYCQSGGRSVQAFNLMVSMKFREVYNMLGGFKKWKADGFAYVLDSATNIQDNQLQTTNFKLFPNPATDHIILETAQLFNQGSLSIYNLEGQEQIKQPINGTKSEIDISALASGVYMLQLFNSKAVEIKRFVKQ